MTMPVYTMLLQGPELIVVDWMAVRQIAQAFFYSAATVAITLGLGLPLVRARIRRWESRGALPPAHEIDARLSRIEQSLDAVAMEVERVTESQRFLTRVAGERQSLQEHVAERSK